MKGAGGGASRHAAAAPSDAGRRRCAFVATLRSVSFDLEAVHGGACVFFCPKQVRNLDCVPRLSFLGNGAVDHTKMFRIIVSSIGTGLVFSLLC